MSLYGDLAQSIPSAGGNFFKPEQGDNVIRIVGNPIKVYRPEFTPGAKPRYCLTDEGAKKYECKEIKIAQWIIDRKDGQIKVAEFGPMIMDQIAELAETEGYKFDGLPPYDLILKKVVEKKGSGDKTTYMVLPHPTQRGELTPKEIEDVKAKGEVLQFLREKADDKEMVAPF